MADYIERAVNTEKKVKNALTYPVIVAIVAILVIGLLVTFVLPTFVSLFGAFGADLPLATRMLSGMTDWLGQDGAYLMGAIAVVAGVFLIFWMG